MNPKYDPENNDNPLVNLLSSFVHSPRVGLPSMKLHMACTYIGIYAYCMHSPVKIQPSNRSFVFKTNYTILKIVCY